MSGFSYLPLSDSYSKRGHHKTPTGLGVSTMGSSAPPSAISLLGSGSGHAVPAEPSDPVLSTATAVTTPPSTISSSRSSPSSALTSPSPLSVGHTHIPLRRDIASSPRMISSARATSMTGIKGQPTAGCPPSATPPGFQGLGAHLHYMLNKDSQSTGNLTSSASESSGGLLKNKLLKHHHHHHSTSNTQPRSPELGTPLLTPRGSPSPSQMSRTSSVKETHHISIDYDPVSGRKQLNTYEIIKELGRGQHGKVKLAKDMETGEFVVSAKSSGCQYTLDKYILTRP
jgi:hypothetical protein